MNQQQPIPHVENARGATDADYFYLKRLNLPLLSLPEPFRTPLSTSKGSITTPAPTTTQAVWDDVRGLKKLWLARECWPRLFAYVSYEAFEHNQSLNPPPIHVSDCPGAPKQPPEFYQRAVLQSHSLQVTNHLRRRPILTSNESAQDIMQTYVYDILDAYFQMRFNNHAAQLDGEPLGERAPLDLGEAGGDLPFLEGNQRRDDNELPDADERKKGYRDTRGATVPPAVVAQTVFYPVYSRVILNHHLVPKRDASGYTDRLLLRHPGWRDVKNPKRTQCAISEVNTPWSYTTEAFERIIGGHSHVLDENSLFQKFQEFDSIAENALLKQLWGQCHSLGPDIGFTTNLEVVMIVIRVKAKVQAIEPSGETGADDPVGPSTRSKSVKKVAFDETAKRKGKASTTTATTPTQSDQDSDSGFIVSDLLPWTDHRLLPCLIGMSYLALDEEDWINTGRYQSLRDILCPGDECKRIYRAQG